MTTQTLVQKLLDIGMSRGNVWIQQLALKIQENQTVENIREGEAMLGELTSTRLRT